MLVRCLLLIAVLVVARSRIRLCLPDDVWCITIFSTAQRREIQVYLILSSLSGWCCLYNCLCVALAETYSVMFYSSLTQCYCLV